MNFAFGTPSSIIFGAGTMEQQLGAQVKKLNGSRVFILTDPGIAKVGILEKVQQILKKEGFEVGVYDQVVPEPPIETVDKIAEEVKDNAYDLLVGLGGGSAMDVTKVVSILVTNGGSARDYTGSDKIKKPGLPTIMLPTTAGTGSEVTKIAIFSFPEEEVKKGIVSPHLFATAAIVDPSLTYKLPPNLTAYTGMDAFIHAAESYISKNANKFTEGLSLIAIDLIAKNLRTAVSDGDNAEARYNMSLGSLIAGIAFGNAGVGAVHAMAYPLGGQFHLPHGLANTLMLRYVMEYNVVSCLDKFAVIAEAMGENTEGLSVREAAFKAIEAMINLAKDTNVPTRLRDVNIPKEAIPKMAAAGINETRLLSNNPRKLTQKDLEDIYTNAW
ncbi:MAG: iron-containing alcohol dehydrogenase [Firmicutes bacterium]|nr:iron-containing alcohol dehydrogenase [Bacillota bacterium]